MNLPKKITVVGSTNMDMVVNTSRIPVPGETILAGSFFMNPGGKGANQAVAVARLGGDVQFISKVGNDVFGRQAYRMFGVEGINTNYLLSDEDLPSGVALITVEQSGENSIVVAPGANAALLPADLNSALEDIGLSCIVLMQLEIPMETVKYVAKHAHKNNVKVVLNPAPAAYLHKDLLKSIDILTPNMTEASIISGIEVKNIDDALKAALKIHDMGVTIVIITMGERGALICDEHGGISVVKAPKVATIDTTAAGDVFNGALVVALSENRNVKEATHFACVAASIAVTKKGAQSSIPHRNEVMNELFSLNTSIDSNDIV